MQTKFGSLNVDLRDQIVARLLYLEHTYEQEVLNFIEQVDLKGSVCVDVGANLGLHSVFLSGRVGEQGAVVAFEPESHNFDLLTQNLKQNQCANVVAHQKAVGDQAGIAHLQIDRVNFGDHRTVSEANGQAAIQSVEIVRLDDALTSIAEGKIKLIKIDVQGHEVAVLAGMKETIRRNPEVLLLIEVFPAALRESGHSATELVLNLQALGFKGWEIHPHRVFPALSAESYELIHDGKDVNLVFAKNEKELNQLMANYWNKSCKIKAC